MNKDTPRSKQSSDRNDRLLLLEVKNLMTRVAELTATVDQLKLELQAQSQDLDQYDELLETAAHQDILLEEQQKENEKLRSRLEYQSSELVTLKAVVIRQETMLEDLRARIRRLEDRDHFNNRDNTHTPVWIPAVGGAITEVDWPPKA